MKIVVTGTRDIPNIMGGVETHCQKLLPRIDMPVKMTYPMEQYNLGRHR